MRDHLTLKQIAAAIGVRETYAGQAFDPALRKVATLFLRYPVETIQLLAEESGKLRSAVQHRHHQLPDSQTTPARNLPTAADGYLTNPWQS